MGLKGSIKAIRDLIEMLVREQLALRSFQHRLGRNRFIEAPQSFNLNIYEAISVDIWGRRG
jgi:hypothetical protein